MSCIKIDLARGALIEPRDILDRALQTAGGQQITLLDVVEQRTVVPCVIAEAPVFRACLDDRLGLAAEETLCGALPQRHVIVPEGKLRLHEPGRIRHHPRRHLKKSRADRHRIGHAETAFAILARQEIGDKPLAFFGDLRDLPRQLGGIGRRLRTRRFATRGGASPRGGAAGTCAALCIAHPKVLTRYGWIKCSDGRSRI